MRDFSTVGFLSNSRKTISFTIPLNKNALAEEIYFNKMDIQVRHIQGGFLIDEDVIQGDYTVITQLRPLGIFVTITREDSFEAINDIPLSIYIKEAEGVFA